MESKLRVVRRNGTVEVKVTLVFTEEEADGAARVADDPNVALDKLRIEGDVWQRTEFLLAYLRILVYWVSIWGSGDKHLDLIMAARKTRGGLVGRKARRKKR